MLSDRACGSLDGNCYLKEVGFRFLTLVPTVIVLFNRWVFSSKYEGLLGLHYP